MFDHWRIAEILQKYAFSEEFFENHGLNLNQVKNLTISELFAQFSEDEADSLVLTETDFLAQLTEYIQSTLEFIGENRFVVESITLLPGTDKSGKSENFDKIQVKSGEVVAVVGPTGSGKSRLLADIEWVAQADTPSKRRVLLNEQTPDLKWRYSTADKLVAQLSQNMNFVMDLTVYEFLQLHARSRLVPNEQEIINQIIAEANALAGEKFSPETAITSLSGGQSRALMIADTAFLSKSPIVLIDEIENAGIDRQKALKVLLKADKVVLMATHDPLLALMADRRLIIKNGGIARVIETTAEERQIMADLEVLDRKVQTMRHELRAGEILKPEVLSAIN